jgi:transposase
LPKEKPSKTIGLPIVPFRKVLDDIVYILRTGCQWKMLPSGYGSGFNMSYDFKNGSNLIFLRKYGSDYSKYDNLNGTK